MPGTVGGTDSELGALYAQAQAARRQSRLLAGRLRATRTEIQETLQHLQAARDRTDQICELWLATYTTPPSKQVLRYSAYARLKAQLATMPVIEQAKGIIMAQCGWPEDQAFDALRRASQRENVKLRDLAARIVATAAESASAQPQPSSRPAAAHSYGHKAAG